MESAEENPRSGRKPLKDINERRLTRSVSLNQYEFNALTQLSIASGAKSTGDFLSKLLKLPSTKVAADKFKIRR